jgi:7-cyano-7-deazaguanine synthase
MGKAVVLLSGGLDSSTLTAQLVGQLGRSNVTGLIMLYGQRHQKREYTAALAVAGALGIQTWTQHIDPGVLASDASALTGDADMPHMTYEEIEAAQGVSPTYVPFRNGNFISIATAFALVTGHDIVALAVHAEDARGFAYPRP